MHRAHKIRLHPTPDQAAYFRRATGTQRFVFNWGLAQIKDALDAGEKPPHVLELKKTFNAIKREQFPWVYDVTKCAVEGGFQNLQAALSNFFQSKKGQRKGKRMGFPHRKTRKRGDGSLTLANDKVSHEGHTVTIPRAGKVNMTEAVRFDGKLLQATVSYHAGWWWISFTIAVPHEAPAHQGHAIGIDVGVKDLAVDSDGQRYENQAPLHRSLSDASMSEFHRQPTYKAEWHGSTVQRIDRFFPSSQLHYGCGGRKTDLTLAERQWVCPEGGTLIDRDLNAACNIRDEALRVLAKAA